MSAAEHTHSVALCRACNPHLEAENERLRAEVARLGAALIEIAQATTLDAIDRVRAERPDLVEIGGEWPLVVGNVAAIARQAVGRIS